MRRLAYMLLLLLALPATAQESLDDLDKAAKPAENTSPATATSSKKGQSNEISAVSNTIAEVNGYADSRTQFTWVNPNVAPLPTTDIPTLQEIIEGNVQLKVHLGKKAFAYADV